MSAKAQEMLQQQLSGQAGEPEPGLHGIGLINVYRRLQLIYPDRVEPVIESSEGEFTRIGFKISDIYQENL